MTTTLRVRVNPDNPSEFATYSDPSDTYSPWYRQGTTYPQWVRSSELSDWDEFTLDVPEPKRRFKPGDVVKVQGGSHAGRIRVRDVDGYWKAVTGGATSTKLDHHIRDGLDTTYELLGNVKDLEPMF